MSSKYNKLALGSLEELDYLLSNFELSRDELQAALHNVVTRLIQLERE